MMTDGHLDAHTLLARKLKAFQHFLTATRELKAALATTSTGAIQRLLQDRDELIRIIAVLDDAIGKNDSLERSFSRSHKSEIIIEIRQTLELIASENLACEELAAFHCREMKNGLNETRQIGTGFRVYTRSTDALGRPPKFISFRS